MIDPVKRLAARVAALEQRIASMARLSTVAQVDPAAGTVRVEIAPGHLSPPIPYQQQAGGLAVHAPPTVGQEMMVVAPTGEIGQGLAMLAGYAGDNVRPGADGNTNAIAFGGVTLTLSAGRVTIDGADLVVTGGDVIADGISLKAHVHGGVALGLADTEKPK